MAKDYYEILGVARDASEDEIKTAYRKLASIYHPDVSKDPNANEKMAQINEAYSTLRDSSKRANYDQYGSNEGTNSTSYNYNPNRAYYEYASGYVFPRNAFSFGRVILGLLFAGMILSVLFRLITVAFSFIHTSPSSNSSNNFTYAQTSANSDDIYITDYNGTESTVTINRSYSGFIISGIGEGAFKDNHYLKTIRVTSSLTTIDDNAFKGCINLKYVVFVGTKTEFDMWKSTVVVGSGNEYFTNATFSYADYSL